MKTITKSLTAVLVTIFAFNFAFANNISYKLTATNLKYTSEKSLVFDIVLSNTDSDDINFKYSLGQFFFEFNPDIANGGTLSYSMINSDLPYNMRPRNASVSGNHLRLAVNPVNQNRDVLPSVDKKSHAILIARMKLETSADKFSNKQLNLKWINNANIFQTKIFVYENDKHVEITNPENHFLDFGTAGLSAQDNISEIPKEFSLLQNYPNPFNPETKIKFDIPSSAFGGVRGETSNVKLIVYDITGRTIATLVNEKLNAGRYEVSFSGANVSSGIYFYKIQAVSAAGEFVQIKKMILIK